MSSTALLDVGITEPITERIYSNQGNTPLIDLLDKNYHRVLDIGCGAGDNAALVKSRNSACDIVGITRSASEAALAQRHMSKCWVIDVEDELPAELASQSFDVLIFSHVLEHLRDPAVVLARFSRLLCRQGQVLVAVPNIVSWPMRVQFLFGDFQYHATGVLDNTHLRFFSYLTADRYLLSHCTDLELMHKVAPGNLPLWWLRRHVLPTAWIESLDRWGSHRWPNLFGRQVLMRAVKR
jgi:2-polyprenyl-3-methyl-5-hydroxy-6-metoxy-1,4-benzoquinol methylase